MSSRRALNDVCRCFVCGTLVEHVLLQCHGTTPCAHYTKSALKIKQKQSGTSGSVSSDVFRSPRKTECKRSQGLSCFKQTILSLLQVWCESEPNMCAEVLDELCIHFSLCCFTTLVTLKHIIWNKTFNQRMGVRVDYCAVKTVVGFLAAQWASVHLLLWMLMFCSVWI